jgi:hypothetical protein
VNANAVHINGAAAGASPPLPPCNHANKPPPKPATTPPPAASARPAGAAVITGPASTADTAAAATTGAADAGTGVESPDADLCGAESCSATTTSGTTADPAPSLGDRPARTDGTGSPADGATAALGGDTAAPVFTGISEPPRRRGVGAVLSPELEPPPRTVGADTAPESAGESLPDTAGSTAPESTGSVAASTAGSTAGSVVAPPERPLPAVPAPDIEGPLSVAEVPRPRGRSARDDGRDVGAEPAESEPAESELDPPEPVVSANATGAGTTADPTPSTTANAPTRPTYRAYIDVPASVAVTARRRYSIPRTRPFDERR